MRVGVQQGARAESYGGGGFLWWLRIHYKLPSFVLFGDVLCSLESMVNGLRQCCGSKDVHRV